MNHVDVAIETAVNNPTRDNLVSMWTALFALPAWYLVPADADQETTPMVLEENGHWLLIFSSLRRFRTFEPVGDEIQMLVLRPDEVVERASELDAIDGICLNCGSTDVVKIPTSAFQAIAKTMHQP